MYNSNSVRPVQPAQKTITVPMLKEFKSQHRKISMVTAYDFTFAHMFDAAGADVLLVGDSLGMVIQGHDSTLQVTLEDMVYHSKAVRRGAKHALVIADMPFMTYQVSAEEAIRNAARLIQEGNAHAVKLEGGKHIAPTIAKLVEAGIPVMGHVGLTPQHVHQMGGFKVQGKNSEDAERIVEDAIALDKAGVFSIVLEGIPSKLAKTITEAVSVPTIGIGAGPDCDGQVLVGYDLLGLSVGSKPKFVKNFEELHQRGMHAMEQFIAEVQTGLFPSEKHCYSAGQQKKNSSAEHPQDPMSSPESMICYGPQN